jgi:hypothetical protein
VAQLLALAEQADHADLPDALGTIHCLLADTGYLSTDTRTYLKIGRMRTICHFDPFDGLTENRSCVSSVSAIHGGRRINSWRNPSDIESTPFVESLKDFSLRSK